MIIDRNTAPTLEESGFKEIPDENAPISLAYTVSDLEIRYRRSAPSVSELSVVYLPYSVTVRHKGRTIFAATIECDDLRAMSPLMGVSLRELQSDYSTKGFYGPKRIMLYGNGERESLGPYVGSEKEDEVISFLLSLVLDSFDEIDEPVRLEP